MTVAGLILGASRARRAALLFLCLIALSPASFAQNDSEYVRARLAPQQTIRQLALQYLEDGNLWPDILRASGVQSIADLRPGQELRIPANEISTANTAVVDALMQIQGANRAGARIFAPTEINKAVSLYDDALQRRLEREWRQTRTLAAQSLTEATTALKKSTDARDQSAEALVSDRNGNVEGQRPQDVAWRNLILQSLLIQDEKIRTLSDSTAQITFRDASRLRLNANSNAIIQRLRYDPLSRTEEARVSLVEGDFYAVLANPSARARFNVEVPGVNATVDSGNFWVGHDQSGAKFTNYDDKNVRVLAQGETVNLGRNEGTVIRGGTIPQQKIPVLASPNLVAPGDDQTVYRKTTEFAWSTTADAAGYWIEIAADQKFSKMVISKFGLKTPGFATSDLKPGRYFWRTAAIDEFGLPGTRSAIWRFDLAVDDTPPYLMLRTPAAGAILRQPAVLVAGESERGARVTVQGQQVPVATDGRFETTIQAAEGTNKIVVVAADAAGNEAKSERSFDYVPDRRSLVRFDPAIPKITPDHFLADSNVISLGGTTTANAQIRIRTAAGDVRASAATDAAGVFRVNVPLTADAETLSIAVIAVSGFTSSEDFKVTIDRSGPTIALDEALPRLTSKPELALKGRTRPGVTLMLNGKEIRNDDGRFDATVTLKPGENTIEMIATNTTRNVRAETWSVKLDQEPPALVRSAISVVAGANRPTLSIEVVANDASGLAKVAPFKVAAGAQVFSGHLRYNSSANLYQGTVSVPETALRAAVLQEVELQDDAGNKRTYTIR